MPRFEITLPRNPGCPAGFRALRGAAAALVLLSGCLAPTIRSAAPPELMTKAPAEEETVESEQTLYELIESMKDGRHKARLVEFKRSFSETDRFYIAELEDRFEITVSHRSSGGYTGGAEAYSLDKRSGKIMMLWHEHPMRMPGIEEPMPRSGSGGGEGADRTAREFTIRGVQGMARAGAYNVHLLGVTLEVSDEGHAVNLSLHLVDAAGAAEDLFLTVPAPPCTGEARCRFGVITLTAVDDLDGNFYRSPENITWHFLFRPD